MKVHERMGALLVSWDGAALIGNGPPLVERKGPAKGPVILGAPQGQHHIGSFYVPPGPGTLQPHVADELVG